MAVICTVEPSGVLADSVLVGVTSFGVLGWAASSENTWPDVCEMSKDLVEWGVSVVESVNGTDVHASDGPGASYWE